MWVNKKYFFPHIIFKNVKGDRLLNAKLIMCCEAYKICGNKM